jgi:hypothetical protein
MLKRSVLLFVVLLAVLASARPVWALEPPIVVYVDTAYTGTEEGTQDKPYNTIAEANAVAQNNPGGGGLVMVKKNGTYVPDHFVPSVKPGQTGIPLAGPVLYALLAVLSLILILVGWQFARRSRQLQH